MSNYIINKKKKYIFTTIKRTVVAVPVTLLSTVVLTDFENVGLHVLRSVRQPCQMQ